MFFVIASLVKICNKARSVRVQYRMRLLSSKFGTNLYFTQRLAATLPQSHMAIIRYGRKEREEERWRKKDGGREMEVEGWRERLNMPLLNQRMMFAHAHIINTHKHWNS